MNQKQIITGMMPAIARYNAALPPRWGRVIGAVKLVEMYHIHLVRDEVEFLSFCGLAALDAKSHGPFCRMAAAVARDIALADRDWRWEQRGVLMGLAHPEVAQILARGFEIGQLRREESVAYAAVLRSLGSDPGADDVLEKARAERVAAWKALTESVAAAMQAGKIAPDWGAISYRELSGLTVADCVRLLDTCEVATPPHREAEAHELRALAEAAATVESSGTGA